MRLLNFVVFSLFFMLCSSNDLEVESTSGLLRGILSLDAKTMMFLGVPYATPPINNLRFKPPTDFPKQGEPIDVSKFGNSCLQKIPPGFEDMDNTWWLPNLNKTSEDCLFLNIWAPFPKQSRLPVMIWIHGGGFETGSGSVYNGEFLASKRDVVVVTINYRLNIFGFLFLDNKEVPGNMGLMDQALGFSWIKRNVDKFGGDPNRITIFGESAGGGSVGHHINIRDSVGLFERAILESGSSTAPWAFVDSTKGVQTATSLATLVNCTGRDLASCLRAQNAADLINASLSFQGGLGLAFSPVIDGSYIEENPRFLLMKGKFNPAVDILLGDNKEDGSIFALWGQILTDENSFISEEDFVKYTSEITRQNDTVFLSTIKSLYTGCCQSLSPVLLRKRLIELMTDFTFTCSTNELADAGSLRTKSVYRYVFSHAPNDTMMPSWGGAYHGSEIFYVFGNQINMTEEEKGLSEMMMTYWTNFAKQGDPNSDGLTLWPKYTIINKEYLEINITSQVQKGVRLIQCAIWNSIYSELKDFLPKSDLNDQCSSALNVKASWLTIPMIILAIKRFLY